MINFAVYAVSVRARELYLLAEEHADRQIQHTANSLSKRRKLARQGKFCLFGHSGTFPAKQQNEQDA